MPYSLPRGLALAGALLLIPAVAVAQAADSIRFTGDVGLVNTAGNTNLTTVNVGEEVRWRRGRLILGQVFAVVYGRSEGETTSSLWRGGVRGDYTLSERVALYATAAYDRDRFAGIARRFEEGAGIAVVPLLGPHDRFETETGLSLVQQRSTEDARDNFVSARGAVTYVHTFTSATYLRQSVETNVNLENASDFRVTSESALVAPLSRSVALKIGYVVRFDNLPEPGFRTTDRLLTSGLQISY